jgi:tRNA(Ile)-lysidine synthetase-like protein
MIGVGTTLSVPDEVQFLHSCYNYTMNISVEPGVYIVAVSGGVDSMVLLDLLRRQPDLQLVVAHVDHGIRTDAGLDRELVQKTAAARQLPFVYMEARLGPTASEAAAREVRYTFLQQAKQQHGARRIITAHHQDDVLETAVLNLLRGTGRKGLSSLQSSTTIVRPLLTTSKHDIRAYAQQHDIQWREDTTNQDDRYLRNYVRHQVLPRLDTKQQKQLHEYIAHTARVNVQLDTLLVGLLDSYITADGLDRQWFMQLPYDVAAEVTAAWLRSSTIRTFDRKLIHRLVVMGKTAAAGKAADIDARHVLRIEKRRLRIDNRHPS